MVKIILLLVLWAVTGIAAAYSGAGGSKMWRRLFVPGITTIIGILGLWSLWAITMMARAGALSLGYGIPDPPTQPNPDEGSPIGRFWFKIFKNYKKAAIATRGTIGFIESISIIVIPILTGAWALWILAMLLICFNNIFFAVLKNSGASYKLFGKTLSWQETFIHGNDSVIIALLVLLCR